MAKNVHGVTKKMWKKWQGWPQGMFNRLWNNLDNMVLLCPGGDGDLPHLTKKQLSVLRWNICFTAAMVAKTLCEDCELWGNK